MRAAEQRREHERDEKFSLEIEGERKEMRRPVLQKHTATILHVTSAVGQVKSKDEGGRMKDEGKERTKEISVFTSAFRLHPSSLLF